MKKIVQRTCIGCNLKTDKRDLIRIVLDEQNKPVVDITGKKPGRGLYICGKEECMSKIIKSKKLAKELNTSVNDEFYESINEIVKEKNNKKSEEGDIVG